MLRLQRSARLAMSMGVVAGGRMVTVRFVAIRDIDSHLVARSMQEGPGADTPRAPKPPVQAVFGLPVCPNSRT